MKRVVFSSLALAACTAGSEPTASNATAIGPSSTVVTPAAPSSRDTTTMGRALRKTPGVSAPACIGAAESAGADAAHLADALDEALGYAGLDRDSLGLSAERTALSALAIDDVRMLEGTRTALRRPIDLRKRGRDIAAAFDAAIASDQPVTRAITAASSMRESAVNACIDPAWLVIPSGKVPLAVALEQAGLSTTASSDLRNVPLALQQALVPIVRALAWAASEVTAARSNGVPPQLLPTIASVPGWLLGAKPLELSETLTGAFEQVDTRRIAAAAASFAYVVEQMNLRTFAGSHFQGVTLQTTIGSIVLRGASNDLWDSADAPALLIDTGGNDIYYGPIGSSSLARPISIAIDLGGRDLYAYRESKVDTDSVGARLPSDGAGRAEDGRTLSAIGRQGSGVLGIGLLFDLGTEADHYRSLAASQGAGSHGVGVLYDAGGDDLYEAEGFSQGAAAWGVGLLLDQSGADRYLVANSGQAFGFTRGIGAIVDAAGSDTYTADPGDLSLGGSLLYLSDQLPGPPTTPLAGTHSFSQGCGAGHRPDWPDPGWAFPGGIGVLRDARGDDRYTAGVFAQACGFVQGTGMLLDGAGNDTYDALYWAQGIAAHLAAASLADDGGNDLYDTRFPVQGPMLGVGHDLSVALHGDASGDDVYRGAWFSLGSGVANGIGVFVDAGGHDRFTADSTLCLGSPSTSDVREARRTLPSIAIFVKANGSAEYMIAGAATAHSGRTWRPTDVVDSTIEIGVGIDRPNGTVAW